jgi:hypothetical protein
MVAIYRKLPAIMKPGHVSGPEGATAGMGVTAEVAGMAVRRTCRLTDWNQVGDVGVQRCGLLS